MSGARQAPMDVHAENSDRHTAQPVILVKSHEGNQRVRFAEADLDEKPGERIVRPAMGRAFSQQVQDQEGEWSVRPEMGQTLAQQGLEGPERPSPGGTYLHGLGSKRALAPPQTCGASE